jgi:acyl-CoA thioester hydrolase
MGVVYYANYLVWFEVARGAHFKQLDADYNRIEAGGVFFPVVEAHCRYHQSARYGDSVKIRVALTELSVARCRYQYEVLNADSGGLLAEGYTVHGFVNHDGHPLNLRKHDPPSYSTLEACVEPLSGRR